MPDESYFRNEFRDTQIENLIQAHVIKMQAPRPPTPMEIPLPPRHWVDREDHLAELESRLTSPNPAHVVITGERGSGKTSTASMTASKLMERYPDGQLYIDLAADGLLSAMRSVLLRLGEAGDQPSATLGGLVSLYRSTTRDKRMLVVVDGVNRSEQGLIFRPSSDTSGFILIARQWPHDPDAHRIELRALEAEPAQWMLTEACPWIDQAEAARLIAAYGGNPGTVRRLAGLIRARKAAEGDTDQARQPIDLPSEQLLDATYNALGPSAAWLYRFLSVLPGNQFERSIMEVFRTPADTGDGAFAELVNAALVSETRPGWFHIDEEVSEDAARRIETDGLPIELLTATRQSLRWYVKRAHLADAAVMGDRLRLGAVPSDVECPNFPGRIEALAWLQDNRTVLTGALRVATLHLWSEEAFALAEAMWALFANVPYPEEAEHCYRLVLGAADTPVKEARLLVFLGKSLTDLGRFEEARFELTRALDLAQTADDLPLIGTSFELLGRLAHKQGDPQKAIPWYERALENARDRRRARSIGWQLLFLGQAHRDLDRPGEARDHFVRSVEQFVLAGDARTAAVAELDLALLDVATGADAKALGRADNVIAWMRQIGAAAYEARAQERLGELLDGEDRRRRYEAAAQIYDRVDSVQARRLRRLLE